MTELIIDKEFRDKIPPLTQEEFDQLRENIINDGEVYEPIVVWNGTIIDGHNRWKIIQEFPNIPFRIKEMSFSDKWEAFNWMYSKQLGRRNLTDEQRTLLIGKMYQARKKAVGAQAGNQNAVKNNVSKMDTLISKPHGRIGEQIAEELGIGNGTVLRADKFAKGIDALSEVSKEAAVKVLQGKSGATKGSIANLANASEEDRKDMAQQIINGTLKSKRKETEEEKAAKRQMDAAIDESVAAVRGESKSTYTLADALDELRVIESEFISKVKRVIEVRGYLIKGNDTVKRTIGTWAFDIEELKGAI